MKSGTILGVLIAVGILLAAGYPLVQIATSQEYQDRMKTHAEHSQAYCEQVYDDETLLNAMVVGNHGGFHCNANENGPHLHAIPQEYKEQAYQAQQNGTDLNWSFETAREQAEPTPFYQSYLAVIPIAAVIALAIGLVVGIIARVRNGEESE